MFNGRVANASKEAYTKSNDTALNAILPFYWIVYAVIIIPPNYSLRELY